MTIEKRSITLDQAAHIAAARDADPQSVCEVLACILEKHGLMDPDTVQNILGGKANQVLFTAPSYSALPKRALCSSVTL